MTNHRDTRSGFTIVELMVVLSIILLLVSILIMPFLERAQRTSWSVSCASNLSQISKATLTWKSEQSLKRKINISLNANDWPTDLMPYMSGQGKVYECPESDMVTSSGLDKYYFLTYEGRESRTPLVPGLWVRKISTTQIDAAIANGRLANGGRADNWNVPIYVADADPNTYWLVYENMQGPSDRDYKDVITKVEVDGKQIAMSFFRSGDNGGLIFLHDDGVPEVIDKRGRNKRTQWIDTTAAATFTTGNRRRLTQEGPSLKIDSSASTYGMNDAILDIPLGIQKLLAMDYPTLRASAVLDNWADWTMPGSLSPSFARHLNDQVNIAWLDGSVHSAWWGDYDPVMSSVAQTYWLDD